MRKHTLEGILRYQKGRRQQNAVRKAYLEWRFLQNPPIPIRCDNLVCPFHTSSLKWNGANLRMVLDHKNGVNGDNRPKNLQLLCPNCNSQQETHGGKNKGRVEQSDGGFSIKRKDGKKDYTLPVDVGRLHLDGNEINLFKSPDEIQTLE
jgi:hypothetical protein